MREEIRGDPGSGIVGALIALPSNQVAELTLQAVVDFGVQDFGDLILLLVINFHQRRRLDFAVRNGAGFMGFELRDVKDGVDGSHILGELDLDGVGTGASDDLVRAKVLFGKLLRRSSSLYELGEEEDFGSDRKLTLGADPYLPRGLIESFLRVFKHFALKIPRGKVRVF